MARKRTSASRAALQQVPDNLARIHGIGPIIEKRLHSSGICTFAQLATLPSETIAALIPNLSAKQIIKQAWIQQACELASSNTISKTLEKEPVISASRQHYENFTFEFLLNEKNKIRRMQVVHVQSGDVDTWTKWDAERLMDFLARHAGMRLPYAKSTILTTVKPQPISTSLSSAGQPSETDVETTSLPTINKSEENTGSTKSHEVFVSTPQILPASDQPPSAVVVVSEQFAPPAVSANAISSIRLLEWKTCLSNTNQSLHNLPHDRAFDINLTLDLTHACLSEISQLDFTTSLYAKKLGGGLSQLICKTQSTVPYAQTVDLTIGSITLSQGFYRLEALLTLIPIDSALLARPNINTSFQGGLFQVY